jgi:hypothetical protein
MVQLAGFKQNLQRKILDEVANPKSKKFLLDLL